MHAKFSQGPHPLSSVSKKPKQNKSAFHRDVGIMVVTAEYFFFIIILGAAKELCILVMENEEKSHVFSQCFRISGYFVKKKNQTKTSSKRIIYLYLAPEETSTLSQCSFSVLKKKKKSLT